MKNIKVIKKSFALQQKIVVATLCVACVLFFAASGCGKQKSEPECPVRVYTKQENKPTKEQLEKYKPHIDVINSMGTFWIEQIDTDTGAFYSFINFHCQQLFNNILLGFVSFSFYVGEDGEEWLNSMLNSELDLWWNSYHKKNGFYFKASCLSTVDVQLPVTPVITPHEAIQAALKKYPHVEFCQYELCYWQRTCNVIPKLSWKLNGRGLNNRHPYLERVYTGYIDALTGDILSNF